MAITLPVRDYDRTLNSEVERLLYQNHVNTTDAQGLAADLNEEQFLWRPATGRWSVGECIEHLNITHRQWLPMMETASREGRSRGAIDQGPYAYGFFSRLFLRLVQPPARLKVKTPAPFRPQARLEKERVMEEFVEFHERAARIIRESNGVDLAKVRVPSAFSHRIRYPLGMGFWILTAHDRRHILQARNVRRAKGFPEG